MLISILLIAFFQLTTAQESQFPVYFNCKTPMEGELQFTSQLIVHQDFVKAKNPRAAIDEHIKFVRGFFHFGNKTPFQLIPKDVSTIKVKEIKEVGYGRNIEFDYQDSIDPNFYPASFHKNRAIKSSEKALRITYQAKIKATRCDDELSNSIELVLPIDPYLAYWSIAPDKRLMIADSEEKRMMNPCASWRMVKEKYPHHYWYFWMPRLSSTGANGERFDCSSILKEGRDVITTKAIFKEHKVSVQRVQFDSFKGRKDFNVSILMGPVGKESSQQSIVEIINFLRHQKNFLRFVQDDRMVADALDSFRTHLDPALHAALIVMTKFSHIAKIKSSTWIDKQTHIIFDVVATLPRSQKRVNLKIYLGPTDSTVHAHFTKESFSQADFIFFVSHSAHGRNMSVHSLEGSLQLSPEDFNKTVNKRPYLMIGLISCFATSYHEKEYKNLRMSKGRITDVMLMGSEGYPFLAPLTFMNILESGEFGLEKVAGPNDFFVIDRAVH